MMRDATDAKAYEPVQLKQERLPGEVLYDHPADVMPAGQQRIWEVLQVILPGGELELRGVPGEWGESYREDRFAKARQRALAHATDEAEDGRGAISFLGREYRIETQGRPAGA